MSSATTPEPDADIIRIRGWLEEIGEFGMGLIRQAAVKAAAQLDPPEPEPDAPPAPKTPTINYVAEFPRLCQAVRAAISLELRVRTNGIARHSTYVRSPAASDPRQAPLRQTLYRAIRSDPDRPRLQRALNERVDAELLDDPDGNIPIGNVLMKICQAFDIQIDITRLPDEMLPYFDEDEPSPAADTPRPPSPDPPPARFRSARP